MNSLETLLAHGVGFGDTACKYLVPELGAFFVFAAMIVLLLWRPAGLFGRA